jgi:hypothetical protein
VVSKVRYRLGMEIGESNEGRTRLVRQFEGKVVLDSELDSKSDLWTPNWIGPLSCCACFLGSLAPS